MPSFQVYSLRGRRSGVGWLGEVLSQSPLLREWWSRADFIEWLFKLPSNVFPAEEAKANSREAIQCHALFLKECFAVESSKGFSCLCPMTCQNALFRIAACCKEIVSSHEVSQSSDIVKIFCDVLGEHTYVFQLSLRWHFQLLTL